MVITEDENENQPFAEETKPVAESQADAAFKRRVVALTVGAVVLLAFLVLFMSYQLIAIGVKNSRKNGLLNDIALLNEQYEQGEETLEIRRKAVYIEMRARDLGYRYVTDK